MNQRERLMATLRFQSVDRVPDYEFGTWAQTMMRWRQEGMPGREEDYWQAFHQYFRVDEAGYGPGPWVDVGLLPGFEHKVLEEKGDHVVVRDGDGAIAEMMRPELGASIPRYLRHAIETRADWEKMRDSMCVLSSVGTPVGRRKPGPVRTGSRPEGRDMDPEMGQAREY